MSSRWLPSLLFLRLQYQVGIGLRLAGLGDSEGTSPLGYHGERNASKDEARKDSDGKDIFANLFLTSLVA